MTENVQPTAPAPTSSAPSDSERNFAAMRKALEEERRARIAMEEKVAQLESRKSVALASSNDDEDDDEPYINKKVLKREIASVYEKAKQDAKKEAMIDVQAAMNEKEKDDWMKRNSDFYEVMQHAQAFADRDPELADTILSMPEGFARQKLVYKNIKALGLHKPQEPSIQSKIDNNRKPLYYTPSGTGSAPYSNASDYSPQGQKAAYEKLMQLKSRLRV